MCVKNKNLRKPFLLLGATGRLGQMVMKWWSNNGNQDLVVVGQSTSQQTDSNYILWKFEPGAGCFDRLFHDFGPFAGVINLAGITPTKDKNWTDDDYELYNVIFVEELIEAASKTRIQKIILISSAAVYSGSDAQIHVEDCILPTARSSYGISKQRMEAVVLSSVLKHPALQMSILRLGNIAGADQFLINAFRALSGQTLYVDIFPSGHSLLRSYIGPDDLADAIQSVCTTTHNHETILNVAAPKPVLMAHFIQAIEDQQSKRLVVETREAPSHAIEKVALDTRRIEKLHTFSDIACMPGEMVRQALRHAEL